LLAVKGVGSKTLLKVVDYLNKNRKSWADFWVNQNQIWSSIPLSSKIVKSIKKSIKEYNPYSYKKYLKKRQVSVLTYKDVNYPQWLNKIEDKPPLLFVKGQLDLNQNVPIAVVGTRQITPYGNFVTKKISRELVQAGACITSGFMYGVDVLAQKQALKFQGQTVGVLGFGFDHMYPRSHRPLLKEMLDSGQASFISEYPPWVKPSSGTFPRRNRIIAGMSVATVVTEAAEKSGTQITVGYALDYGRDVFAVPGPITNKYSQGVRQMINQGAQLVTSGQEIVKQLSWWNWQLNPNHHDSDAQSETKDLIIDSQLDSQAKRIYDQVLNQMLTPDEIALNLDLEVAQVISQLTKLEMSKLVKQQAGVWFVDKAE
jgi:DNA processing protein